MVACKSHVNMESIAAIGMLRIGETPRIVDAHIVETGFGALPARRSGRAVAIISPLAIDRESVANRCLTLHLVDTLDRCETRLPSPSLS